MAEKVFTSIAQAKEHLAERRKASDARKVRVEAVDDTKHYEHSKVAIQAIKVVNSLPMDPFVKKVMTLRLMGPVVTGHERTHMSIALELGAPIDDVIQAEEFGIDFVNNALEKVSIPDFVEKYRRDRAAQDAIRGELNKG
jgi:hypothetical protein